MNIELPGIWSWLVLGGLLTVLVGLGVVAGWLLRRRRRDEMRAEVAEELRRSAERIGLETVWQSQLFHADVFGIRGKVNGFDIRAELWDKSSYDFFRLSVYFPRPLRQEFRLLARRRRGLEQLWKMESIEVGDRRFEERYNVYCRQDQDERVRDILAPSVRRKLVTLGSKADGVKLGDHSLYIFVDRSMGPTEIERFIRDALAVAVELYNRVVAIGPAQGAAKTSYEMVAVDVLGRDTESNLSTGAFPTGSDDDPEQPKPEEQRQANRDAQDTYPLGSTLPLEGSGGDSSDSSDLPTDSSSSQGSDSTDGSTS